MLLRLTPAAHQLAPLAGVIGEEALPGVRGRRRQHGQGAGRAHHGAGPIGAYSSTGVATYISSTQTRAAGHESADSTADARPEAGRRCRGGNHKLRLISGYFKILDETTA